MGSRSREQKYRLFKAKAPESILSEANVFTIARLFGTLYVFMLAIVKSSPAYNFIGLGIHWVADTFDGIYARRLKQETILGAEIDILADRVAVSLFYIIYLGFHPNQVIPVAAYLMNFCFFDFYLSLQFLKFDIISVNYFYKVDRTVYKLNFSPFAKFCNSTVPTCLLIFLPKLGILALLYSIGLIAVKTYSAFRLFKKRIGKREGA